MKNAKESIIRDLPHINGASPFMSVCVPTCLSLIGTLLLPTFLSDSTTAFSNSIFSVGLAAVLFLIFRRYRKAGHFRRELALTHIFGFLLSFMIASGRAIEQTERFFPIGVLMCLSVLFYTHVFACLISLLWSELSLLEEKKLTSRSKKPPTSRSGLEKCIAYAVKHPWLIALGLLLCWLPCWIALFPGGFSYDMTDEFNQQFITYKSDFPRLHSVLIIGVLNPVHSLTGSYNAGIAVYAIAQMIAFSVIFTHMLTTFYRQKLNEKLICLIATYLALFPVIPLTVTHTGRDTLFAGMLTCLGFLLYQAACDTKSFMSSPKKTLLLGAALSLTVMSRNNNSEIILLALLAVMNIIVWFRAHRLYPRGVALFCLSNIAVFVTLSAVCSLVCQPITPTNPRASMSVISQTLVRAYIDEPEKWTQKDKEDFGYYVRTEDFRYCAECADYSKNLLQNVKGAGNAVGFVKMWVRMGLKCPSSYMNAFLAQTRYMWYPDSVIDGYVRAELYTTEKCYFSTIVTQPGSRINLWPEGEEFYRSISRDISFEKIPLISQLFSIGFQYWLLLNCLFYTVFRRRKKLLLPLCAMCVYLAFCFFIPIVLMRYFMPLFLFFPITAVMTVHPVIRPERTKKQRKEREII